MKRIFRKRDGGYVQNEREPVGLSRGTADRSHQGFSRCFQIREVVPLGKFRALLSLPRVEKQFLEFRDGRAFNLNVRVTPGHLRHIVLVSSRNFGFPRKAASNTPH